MSGIDPTPDLMGALRLSLEKAVSIHWVGDAPTSLHGDGAASFKRTTRDAAEVTCNLCLLLLARTESTD
jgi:hypothetical protein